MGDIMFRIFSSFVGLALMVGSASAEVLEIIDGDDFTAHLIATDSDADTLTYDLVYVGGQSRSAFVARRFMLEMAERVDQRTITSVYLSYKGDRRYQIEGTGIAELASGFQLGEMEAFHTLMQLPFIVRDLEGNLVFEERSGALLDVLNMRAENFNEMLSHWYLTDLLEELK
jgi:hypothetical protein